MFEYSIDVYVFPEDENEKFLTDLSPFADKNGEVTLRFGAYVSRYVPAVITGPVERCHPAEGGEVEDIYFEGVVDNYGKIKHVPNELQQKQIIDFFSEKIEEEAFEKLSETLEGFGY